MIKYLHIGPATFVWGSQTYVMGIINITADSFSGDGLLSEQDWVARALEQGMRFAREGAHILDIGGESTRPGAEAVEAGEEIRRVVPVIAALAAKINLPLSVDTYKAEVAAAALDAGAHMVNDVWGLKMDSQMAALCAQRNIPVIVMHNRSNPRHAAQEKSLGGRYLDTAYDNLLADVTGELQQSVNIAQTAGIPNQHIIIDPGIGFGKTVEQNLFLLNHLDTLKTLGYPILLGTSQKSLIGYTLDLPPEERIEGTAATVAIGIDRGADIIRVHQVKEMSRVARMTDAIVRAAKAPS